MDIKAPVRFLVACVVFTVIFWSTYLFALRPLFYGGSEATAKTSQAEDDELRRKYQEQAKHNEELTAQYERQLTQGVAMLKKQEELLSRWEKVIERWESISPKR